MSSGSNRNIAVFFDTLGCAKNLVDTRDMQSTLIDAGINLVDDPTNCDCIILNTCSFIHASTAESIDAFFYYKNTYPKAKILVCGCMPARYGKDLYSELKEADGFLSCAQEEDIVEAVEAIFFNDAELHSNEILEAGSVISSSAKQFDLYNNKPYAYIKISEGCNRRCSYCMIPKIRGSYKSFTYREICSDIDKVCSHIKSCSSAQIREIILVAQDCGDWGYDLDKKYNLSWLLSHLSSSYPDLYFRILYIQPDGVNEELINTVRDCKNVLNYFDIPIQHASRSVLKNMHRAGDGSSYLKKINLIRENIKGACIRSTLIAGFPGEDEEDFDLMCDFLNEAQLDFCGVFEYSDEEESASYLLPHKVDLQTARARANSYRDIIEACSIQKISSYIGKNLSVLIEGQEDNRYFGRAFFQSPDVDGYVYVIDCAKKMHIGQIINVEICDNEYYDLVGKVIDE